MFEFKMITDYFLSILYQKFVFNEFKNWKYSTKYFYKKRSQSVLIYSFYVGVRRLKLNPLCAFISMIYCVFKCMVHRLVHILKRTNPI